MNKSSIRQTIYKIGYLLTGREKRQCGVMIFFALLNSLMELATAIIIVVFAQILTHPEVGRHYFSKLGLEGNLDHTRIILVAAVFCGGFYFLKNVLAAMSIYYQNITIQQMSYEFKNRLLGRFARADYRHYVTQNSMYGMNVIAGDSELMFSNAIVALGEIVTEGIVFIALVGMMVWINPPLALVVGVVGLLLGLILTKGLFPLFFKWGKVLQDAAFESGKSLQQFFHAFKEISVLNTRKKFIDAFAREGAVRSRVQALQVATNTMPRLLMEVVFVSVIVLTIVSLCLQAKSSQHMIGVLGGYLYVGFRVMPGLNRIVGQLNTFKLTIPNINRVYDEYSTVVEEDACRSIPSFTFNDSIELRNVSFRYLTADGNALNALTLSIRKGETLGVVGKTGSGKTTLIDLLLGLLRPTEGDLLIDGLYPANCEQWLSRVGYVPQTIYLLDDTIVANVAFGVEPAEVDLDRVSHALSSAQLGEFLEKLPEGTATIVGERGIRLSGGERQRIAIARALYRDPEVLIFDEATSALDTATEKALMKTITEVSKARTVIMVAHRLSTLSGCDRIISLKDGRLEGLTTFAALTEGETV